MKFTGTITALVTPFDKNGNVSYADLKKLIEQQIKGGIDGLSAAGTTGESPTLSHEEHIEVIAATVDAVKKRVPVISGTGSNSTDEAIHLSRAAEKAGSDALLVVTPYYNKPSQEGLFQYYTAIAQNTDLPIVLYSVPGRCGIEIGVPTLERLVAKHKNIRHIKEAGGSVDRADQIKRALGNDIVLLSGDDSLTLPMMSIGAEGIISVASNLLPKQVSQMVRHALNNNYAAATKIHRQLSPLFKNLFIEPNPVPVKTALAEKKIIGTSTVRPPLCQMTKENRQLLLATLKSLKA